MNTPCYQCPRRAVNCHSRCPDYAQYRTRQNNSKRRGGWLLP